MHMGERTAEGPGRQALILLGCGLDWALATCCTILVLAEARTKPDTGEVLHKFALTEKCDCELTSS